MSAHLNTITGVIVFSWMLFLTPVRAQITLDGTMGPSGTLSGPAYSIPQSSGTTRGPNLFHSFSRFGIGTGQSATFSGAASILNVFSRVTGGSASNIDGALRSTLPNADLFLVNPAGVVFGPNASLDVKASFHATTADVVRFSDGGSFAADPGGTSSLSVAAPSAFGFLGAPSGAVEVRQGALTVPTGNQLSLIGGGIIIRGNPNGGPGAPAQLAAPSGLIHLASVNADGDVPIANPADTKASELRPFSRLGPILITDSASLNASGANGNGTIVIRGGQLHLRHARVAADSLANAAGTPVALDFYVREEISFIASSASANTFGAQSAGAIVLDASDISLSAGAQVSSVTFGSGAGGVIRINASNELSLSGAVPGGAPSAILANTVFAGDGGSITIDAGRVTITGGAQIGSGTFGAGHSGGVNIRATHEVRLIGTAPGSCPQTNGCSSVIDANTFSPNANAGNAGAILVEAPRVTLLDGGTISSTTLGAGRGGSVTVRASERLALIGDAVPAVGIGSNFFAVSPSAIVAVSVGLGAAGSIAVSSNQVDLLDGGAISSTSLGLGEGGSVAVSATDLVRVAGTASDGTPSTIGASALNLIGASADAGEVIIKTPRLHVTGGARIDTLSRGTGQGGNLTIEASDAVLIFGSSVSTQAAGNGSGGNITLNAKNLLHLVDGEITTSVAGGAGPGGNISIDPQFVILDNSRIQANAFGGPGGNISIVAGTFFADFTSTVEASSQLGIEGSIEIDSPDTNVSGGLVVLPVSFDDASGLLAHSCEKVIGAANSSLVVSGRGGQATNLDGYLFSNFAFVTPGLASAPNTTLYAAPALTPQVQSVFFANPCDS
jgi:filamentous hemagglutinin family protein